MMDPHREQRRFARLPFSRTALLEGPNGPVEARLRDISLNGARVALMGGWAGGPDAVYRLRVDLAPGTRVHMRLHLIHREGASAGFQCDYMDSESLANMKRILALYYGDKAPVERELSRLHELERQ